ncbi:MAG: hypothetical protein PHH54_06925 [Candidatus Nanoarchaeia archaeon]|nr:hypothetical protein [Candidatus Nanoarchaeia archaeon]MDD5741688.1 hypothetical protein [Candidatus Nanoarchaeia archaeon]
MYDKEFETLIAELLYKLYRRGIWGGKHTPLRNLYHLTSKIIVKDSEKAAKELSNLGWIQAKKSTGEIHVSLNPHKKQEIRDFILKALRISPDLLK